jgi:iron complex transport system substrate-binding protein
VVRRKLGRIRVLTGLFLAACSAVACAAPGEDQVDGKPWSYTDDRGVTVTDDTVPTRIIAQVSAAGALTDFGVDVVGTFGPLLKPDGTIEPEAGSVDPRKVTDVTGPGYGEINVELAAALQPDLLVSGKYAGFAGLWHLTQDQEDKVRGFVPIVGIEQSGRPLPEAIAAYKNLARALGADVDSPPARADEARFDAAAQRLRQIGTRLRAQGRTILAIGGTPQEFYVAVPERAPDLDYYAGGLGLPIVTPRHPDLPGGAYFERLSWENVNTYRGDVFLWDTRSASMTPQQMKQNPLFAAQPAAAQDRFAEWDAVAPLSYASYAQIMNNLADQLENEIATIR